MLFLWGRGGKGLHGVDIDGGFVVRFLKNGRVESSCLMCAFSMGAYGLVGHSLRKSLSLIFDEKIRLVSARPEGQVLLQNRLVILQPTVFRSHRAGPRYCVGCITLEMWALWGRVGHRYCMESHGWQDCHFAESASLNDRIRSQACDGW